MVLSSHIIECWASKTWHERESFRVTRELGCIVEPTCLAETSSS